jgi:flavorubredoxin
MEFAKKYWQAWDNYQEKLNALGVWQDNYEEGEFYEQIIDHYECEHEESVDELIESFLQLSSKVCVQNVSLVPSNEKKVFKEIIDVLSDDLLKRSKEITVLDLLKSSKKIFYDNIFSSHIQCGSATLAEATYVSIWSFVSSFLRCSCDRCAYIWVVENDVCPKSSCTVFKSTPAMTS